MLPEDLDSVDLTILRAIATKPDITTREIDNIVFLSRRQTLRRLRRLQARGLVNKTNGKPGKTYYYTLGSDTTPEEIEQFNSKRLNTNRDPIAREALGIFVSGMRAIVKELVEMIRQIENVLK